MDEKGEWLVEGVQLSLKAIEEIMKWLMLHGLLLSSCMLTYVHSVGRSCEDRCGGEQKILCRYFCETPVDQTRPEDQSPGKPIKV